MIKVRHLIIVKLLTKCIPRIEKITAGKATDICSSRRQNQDKPVPNRGEIETVVVWLA